MLRLFLAARDVTSRNALRRALRDHPDIRIVRTEAEADLVVHDVSAHANATVHASAPEDAYPDERSPGSALRDDGESLTDREREVLQRLAGGQGNAEIAAQLSVSTSTVKFHLAAIFAKLGVHTRTEAVATAVRRGLVML